MATRSTLSPEIRPFAHSLWKTSSLNLRTLRLVSKDRPLLLRSSRSGNRYHVPYLIHVKASTDSAETELPQETSITETTTEDEQSKETISTEPIDSSVDTRTTTRASVEEFKKNTRKYGVFLDIGCVIDVFVHVSDVVPYYLDDVSTLVKRGEKVKVELAEIGERIRGTMTKHNTFEIPENAKQRTAPTEKPNTTKAQRKDRTYHYAEEFEGVISKIRRDGFVVKFDDGNSGFLPAAEARQKNGDEFGPNTDLSDFFQEKQPLTVRVLSYDESTKIVELTMETEGMLSTIKQAAEKGFFISDEDDSGEAAMLSVALKRAGIVREIFGGEKDIDTKPEPATAQAAITTETPALPEQQRKTEIPETEPVSVVDGAEKEDEVISVAAEREEIVEEISQPMVQSDEHEIEEPAADYEEQIAEKEEVPVTEASESVMNKEITAPPVEAVFDEDELVIEESEDAVGPDAEQLVPDASAGFVSEEVEEEAPLVAENDSTETDVSEPVDEQVFPEASGEVVTKEVEEEAPLAAENDSTETDVSEPVDEQVFPEASGEVVTQEVEEEALLAAETEKKDKAISASLVRELRERTGAGMMECKRALTESNGNMDEAVDILKKKGVASAAKRAGKTAAEGVVASYIHAGAKLGILVEVNSETDFVARTDNFKELADNVAMTIASSPEAICISAEDYPEEVLAKEKEIEMSKDDIADKPEEIREKIVIGRIEKIKKSGALLEQPFIIDQNLTVQTALTNLSASLGEKISIRRFERFELGEGMAKRSTDLAAEVAEKITKSQDAAATAPPTPSPPPAAETSAVDDNKPVIQVSAAVVKELRQMTGGGMMDCKTALAESGGDLDKAAEYLRMKGLAGAAKKSGRIASEGVICSYIHAGSKIGIIAEINCETDFVSRRDEFKQMADDIAMNLAACPEVEYVSADSVPQEVIEKERQIEMDKEDLKEKPEDIRQKIADGRVQKTLKTLSLLDQPFLKDTTKTVGEVLNEFIATFGENVKVRRFIRYNLGEGIQKEEVSFVEEVAEKAQKSS